jgi:hypothetical protein
MYCYLFDQMLGPELFLILIEPAQLKESTK